MTWNLYERNDEGEGIFDLSGDKLAPLTFSNGKTQADIVEEINKAISDGYKIIFVHGMCGSGKSAMALNLAKYFKRTSIVVPIKSLQEQYERDYSKSKYILKEANKPLSISVIKGRNNFRCPFSGGEGADDPTLPCTIEIRDKNTEQLLDYIQKNPNVDASDFSSASDIKRMNVAPACPYWAPIMPAEVNTKMLDDHKKVKYPAVCGKEYAIFQRKKGCGYYDQHESYAKSDVLIFNSMKYLIESDMGRKPRTDLEIIDECDEFLDSFANERRVSINRLITALTGLHSKDSEKKLAIKTLIKKLNDFLFNPKNDTECEKLEKNDFNEIIGIVLENPNLAEDEEFNYYNTIVEIARSYERILKDTYVSIDRVKKDANQNSLFKQRFSDDDQIFATLVSINLAEKFKELLDQNEVFVMMSGTLHSADVLRDIFGLENFKVIEAETQAPGKIKKIRTGIEKNCSYANFKNGNINRKLYLKIMDMCLAKAEKPVLVHINAFKDLPTNQENEEYKFDNLMTQEELRELQKRANKAIDEFTSGEEDVLFTTKCSRGVDFAGDKCRSIIMSRFPYPNISGLFWKILKKEQPDKFMEFYMDKARRELVQKIARGVRFKGDCVNLLSPDIRVLNARLE
jgi:Rad3-related DNA helicase